MHPHYTVELGGIEDFVGEPKIVSIIFVLLMLSAEVAAAASNEDGLAARMGHGALICYEFEESLVLIACRNTSSAFCCYSDIVHGWALPHNHCMAWRSGVIVAKPFWVQLPG